MKQLLPLIALLLIACTPGQSIDMLTDDESMLTEEPVAETATLTITPTVSVTPTPAPFDVSLAALPLDSNEILYWHEDELRIIGPDGSNDRRLLTGEHITIGLPFASPSGRYLAVSAMQPFVLDLLTGDIFVLSDRKESAIASFFWVPGDILYYVWYDEGFDWKTWRVEMPIISVQELAYGAPEGSVMTDVLNDTYLVVQEPVSDVERQSMVLNWRTGERQPLADPTYYLVSVSEDESHAILYGPGDGLEGGWIAAFYIADFSLEDGAEALHRITPTVGMAYDYHPRLSPNGQYIMVERLLSGDTLLTELVLIELSDTGAYQEIPIAPQEGWLCWNGLWYDNETVIAPCHERDKERTDFSLWLIPLNGELAVRLADEGSLIR